jgi:uncharacterized protein (DUF488 family)
MPEGKRKAVAGCETQGSPPAPSATLTVWTIGHSTRRLEEFTALLQARGIECVADVRTLPKSRHNPQFNRDTLPEALRAQGICYVHLPELGGLRHPKRNSPNGGWRNASFRGFADYMQTPDFAYALERLIELAGQKRLAIMCAEAVPWRCHRSLIADALEARGLRVQHLLAATQIRCHQITPWASVKGTALTYPPIPGISDPQNLRR